MKTPGKRVPRAVVKQFAEENDSEASGVKTPEKTQTLCRA